MSAVVPRRGPRRRTSPQYRLRPLRRSGRAACTRASRQQQLERRVAPRPRLLRSRLCASHLARRRPFGVSGAESSFVTAEGTWRTCQLGSDAAKGQMRATD